MRKIYVGQMVAPTPQLGVWARSGLDALGDGNRVYVQKIEIIATTEDGMELMVIRPDGWVVPWRERFAGADMDPIGVVDFDLAMGTLAQQSGELSSDHATQLRRFFDSPVLAQIEARADFANSINTLAHGNSSRDGYGQVIYTFRLDHPFDRDGALKSIEEKLQRAEAAYWQSSYLCTSFSAAPDRDALAYAMVLRYGVERVSEWLERVRVVRDSESQDGGMRWMVPKPQEGGRDRPCPWHRGFWPYDELQPRFVEQREIAGIRWLAALADELLPARTPDGE